ncbi:MFS transporter [Actinomadura sp. J1-007]|nr:MFS transporter [Actinomadura sp. J1-007]
MLTTVVGLQFLVSLDLSIVNVALPAISRALAFTPSGLQWVVNAYTLVFAGFVLLGGRIGDLVDRRALLAGALVLFAAASAWGGAATAGWMLVAARALQGVAAAVLAPMALALVTSAFPEGPERRAALAWWGMAGAFGGATGVLLGGVLTETLGWRWVFLGNVPIAAVILLAGLLSVRSTATASLRDLDWAGAVLVTAGFAALVYGAVSGGAPVPLAAGLVSLAAFVLVERRVRRPLVPLAFFGRRERVGAAVFGFLLTSAQLAAFYFLSLYLQERMGYTAVQAGLAFVPFSAGIVVGVRAGGALAVRFGAKRVLVAGSAVGASGLAWFGLLTPDAPYAAAVLGPSAVASVGIGAAFLTLGALASTGVPERDAGLASGVLTTSQQLGGSFGLAVLVAVAAEGAEYTTVLLIGALLLVLGGAASAVILPSSRRTPDAPSAGERAGTRRPATTEGTGT